jgi:hypothetical protein
MNYPKKHLMITLQKDVFVSLSDIAGIGKYNFWLFQYKKKISSETIGLIESKLYRNHF